MTNEKAIKWLKVESSYIKEDIGHGKEILEAYAMAIEALEKEPCEDCISREDFIAKVKDIYYGYMLDDDGCCPQDFVDLAEEMPFVTPQVKTGYWIRCDILQELKCSECRRCFRNKTNFCPNCGAKMEVEE